ncbi:M28 family peptidase [Deinococcus hohokamensis]|uniref:M28 family peptidase n=1 Tax=Deinococcus hohokamensis TaxID=309883 RepID=A0ABV9I4U1_9DEIO
MSRRRRPLPTRPPRPVWIWLLPLVLVPLTVWAGVRWATRPQNPPLQAAARGRTVEQDWAQLRSFGPRPAGTAGHDRAADWLAAQLRALGYRVTEQPVELSRPFDQGSTLEVGGRRFQGTALYGSSGGEQQAPLLRVPADPTAAQLEALGAQSRLVVAPCGRLPWNEVADRVVRAGAVGLVMADVCPPGALQKLENAPLPMVSLRGEAAQAVLRLNGQPATLRSAVTLRPVAGRNLVAARVGAAPHVLLGAHFDTVNGTVGANDNASGVLALLDTARRAAGTPLADQLWLVLFDAEEDGLVGSRAFVRGYSPSLRVTRAMLNLDMVGVAAEPLGVASDADDLIAAARAARPALRVFEDAPASTRVTFGRVPVVRGRSDHVSFKAIGLRTLFLHRGKDAQYHAPGDRQLNAGLVRQTSEVVLDVVGEVLKGPWTPRVPCGLTGRDCRY